MRELIVQPHIGVGGVRLNMIREDVHKIMGNQYHSFDKGGIVDAYYSSTFQIFYSEESRVVYIELSREISDKYNIIFNGLSVFKIPATELVEKVGKYYSYDNLNPEIPYSYIFQDADLSFWRAVLPDDENEEEGKYFDTIGIGVQKYYSN